MKYFGGDYLYQARKLLEHSQMKYDHLDKKFGSEWIDGIEFYKMNASIRYMGLNLHQVYYSSFLNNFNFIIILSYNSKEERQELLEVLETLKFTK